MIGERMRNIFVMDIETTSNPEKEQFVPEPTLVTLVDAPKSMKKPETRQNWADKKNIELSKKYATAVDKMALDVDLCRIVTVAWRVQVSKETTLTVSLGADTYEEETEILQAFWKDWIQWGCRMCGYNVLDFDIPILMRRSWALGVKCPPISLRRYSTSDVIDLMQLFYGWGKFPVQGWKYRGLKVVADMYGIEIPMPDVEGSMVADMTKEERCEYCASDVAVTWELAQRMHGVYWT